MKLVKFFHFSGGSSVFVIGIFPSFTYNSWDRRYVFGMFFVLLIVVRVRGFTNP